MGSCKTSGFLHPPARILKVFEERPQLGSITPTIQIVSTAHWSLKAAFLKKAPTVGTVERVYILSTWNGGVNFNCPGPTLRSKRGSRPLDYLIHQYVTMYCIYNKSICRKHTVLFIFPILEYLLLSRDYLSNLVSNCSFVNGRFEIIVQHLHAKIFEIWLLGSSSFESQF